MISEEASSDLGSKLVVVFSTEVSAKLELVKAIRNQFDKAITLASSSIHLQKATLGPLLNSLVGVKPNLEKAKCIENEYRNMIIDMLGRIPLSDIPKQNIADLVKFCHSVLFEDNEDNGAVAQKILADVHKAYKTGLEELSAPYFEWLLKLYANIPIFVDQHLGQKSRGKVQEIIPAVDSIKLSQDIALTVFSLFQSYSRRLAQYGEPLVASMVKLISLSEPSLDQASLSNMHMYTDFKISQVKTLVFLVILSRSSAAQPLVIGHKEAIADSLVLIMKTSPNVLILRKEILNAFRTILSSDELKDGLVGKIDELLNMDVLIGSDRTVGESLKQVAFIHLTELLLMVKQDLKVEFIERVVNMAMESLSDVSVPLTLHVTSVRVLYNIVVDIIFPRRGEDEHFRDILSSILVCMLSKLDALCVQVPRILSISRDLESLHKKRKVGDANAAKEMAKESQIELIKQRQKLEGLIQVKPENDSGVADVKKEVVDAMDVDNQEEKIDKEVEPVDIGVTLSSPFKTVYQATTHASVKERELLEFRNLAHGLVNTTKTVSFVIIVYHTSRGLKSPVPPHIKSWSSRKADVRTLSQIMKSALRFISFFENLVPSIQSFDPRDVLCEMYNVIVDAHDYTDVVGPNVPFIFDTVLSNSWYLGFVRGLLEEESSTRAYSNRYAIACILNYLVTHKTHALKDVESPEGSLVLQLFQMCFETLPRIQNNDLQRAPQLAANGVPSVERVVLPHIIAFLTAMAPKLSEGKDVVGYMKAVRSLFFALAATNKFLDIQSSVGSSGLHTQIVEASLSLLQSPTAASKEVEEMCAEICLLVPARLEHLIPLIPRMMHAAVVALKSRDRSVHIALRVLDVWVESFNPEFIERSMSSVTKPLMTALWSHIKPTSQGPFGHKVAGMLGKMGGRGRRWLVDNVPVEYKEIPEYGLRVILAFPPHTSFLVPLDRCVQLAWSTVSSAGNDSHKRKNALRLLQICAETLTRLHLPSKMLASQCTEEEGGRVVDGLDESNFEKLKDLLFNSPEPPQIPSDMVWPAELGVKTKKQHAAEKKMLETVLTAIVSASCVEEEIEDCKSRSFAHATCRHFAFLMASGWASMAIPPWAPPTSKMIKYDVLGGIPAYIATLKHLQPHILLDAFEQGLKRESASERSATVECITVFLDTLNEIGQLQQKSPSVENDAGKSEETKPSSTRERLSHDIPYLNIQQDLITRARHCCYGTSWASKLGGVLALEAITCRMSQPFLLYAAHYIVKALMTVLRSLPDSATVEINNVTEVVVKIVSRALDSGSSDGKELDNKEEDSGEEEEEEEEEEEPQVKTRRGKRAKRRTVSTRKKQRTSNTKTEKSNDGEHQAKEGSLDRDAARLQNDLLQAVMSSKNNDAVRKAATKCLELLSASSGVTVGSILEQILSRQPASKSLLERRVLPLRSISAQTNYAHSMAFLFIHCPNLPLTDSLGTFVADCCTILEQDDATILSCTSIRGQPPKQSIVVKLRIACLEVLVAALSWPQFRDTENIEVINHKWESLDPRENISQGIESLRTRIVNVFLQKLGSSDKIVELSKRGLMLAVEYKLLEKIKLQEPLKQILVDVGLLNRLNVDHLNHLHSLLDIISDQFQITLGEKLVEHLQAWVEYEVKVVHELTRNGAPHSWEPGTECEVAVKMLDVFHKLPSWASAFLESQVEGKTTRPGLVVLTIGLEQGLPSLPGPAQPSKCWSPYRDPLVKFLNNYPDKSIDYFVKTPSRLATNDYFTMFVDIIQHPSGSVLLEKLKDNKKLLLNILEHKTGAQDTVDGKDNCIELVKIVCDLCPNWLPEELFQACYALWSTGNFAAKSFENLSLIILNYIRRNQHQTSVLLELPSALVGHPGSELTVLKEYLTKDFPRESSQETKKMVRA